MVLWALLTSLNAISIPKLSSYPSAQATIFLDFDGHRVVSSVWNGGNPLVCAAPNLSDAQINDIFNRVAENYRPFNLNITTDSTVFLAAPLSKRIRVIITPTSGWYTGVGGVAYTGSFTWGDDTPVFVFPDRLANSPKIIAECCTHESGHAVGLSHQSTYNASCALVETYNTGVGSGVTGWAPVMGNSYYKNFTGWSNGPTPNGCTSSQDNLNIITTQNGFSYRTDEHSDNVASNPSLISLNNNTQTFSTSGIITTTTDKDAFKIVFTSAGALHLDAIPFSLNSSTMDGANLDIKLTLVNSGYQTIRTYDVSTLLNVVIDTTLPKGTYYILLEGTGNAFASNYGSLGSYTISGSFASSGVLPIRDVALTGKENRGMHSLSWNIISDEPIKTIIVQSSTDGRFFTNLASINGKESGFSYAPSMSPDIFYRLKVASVTDQTVFSNIIALKTTAQIQKFKVSTLVQNEIVVNAFENYKYQVVDIHGRVIGSGSSNAGVNRINVSNIPNGMYIIQMTGKNQKQSERIIKQ